MSNVGIVYENDYFLDAESSAYFVYNKSDYWMQAIYQNTELLSSDDLVVGALPDNEKKSLYAYLLILTSKLPI